MQFKLATKARYLALDAQIVQMAEAKCGDAKHSNFLVPSDSLH